MKKVFLCLLLLTISYNAFSDGIIIPRPFPLPTPVQKLVPLIVKYHRVNVTIKDMVAITEIDEEFFNQYNHQIEGEYIFPLPQGANLSNFEMEVNGKMVQGEVLEKDKARKIYEDIVRNLLDPGLLEYYDRKLFRARIFPIEPKSTKRVKLRYEQTLKREFDTIEYRYPLDIEGFSPDPIEDVSVNIDIHSTGSEIGNAYCPYYNAAITQVNPKKINVSFEKKDVKPDNDFVVFYSVLKDKFGLTILSYKKKTDDGFLIGQFSPEYDIEEKGKAKEITFVVDTSGSMVGDKIEQAKNALKFCINNLNAQDKFNVIQFATTTNNLFMRMNTANKMNIEKAIVFVEEFKARGGTDINSALIKALESQVKSEIPKYIIFLTDGIPTVGTTEINQIIGNTNKKNDLRTRVFIFGIGYDVNTLLLDRLSDENYGLADYIHPKEDIEVKISNFYAKISEPVISFPKIEFDGIKVYDFFPVKLNDVFKGTQLVFVSRYKDSGYAKVKVSGKRDGKPVKLQYEIELPSVDKSNEFIPRIWASKKIGYLLEQIRISKKEDKELVEEIVFLGTKYGIVTPYTSFLVTEDERLEIAAEEATGGADFDRVAEKKLAQAPSAMKTEKGKDAVYLSKGIKSLQEKNIVEDEITENIKYVSDKTFLFRENKWIDSEVQDFSKLKQIKFLSKEYFELLRKHPEIKEYLSVGDKVIFKYKHVIYEITI